MQATAEEFGRAFDVGVDVQEQMGVVIIEDATPDVLHELGHCHCAEDSDGNIQVPIEEFFEYMENDF